jgi:hypothetical protein
MLLQILIRYVIVYISIHLPPTVTQPRGAKHRHLSLSSVSPETSSARNMTFQTTFKLSTRSKGVHLVTKEVQQALGDGLKDCKAGMLFLSIKHTSAALTLNENYDPDVRVESVFSLHFFPL